MRVSNVADIWTNRHDFIFLSWFNVLCEQTNLFEEVAGESEDVEEGGISEWRSDLPMFGQRMRRVGLSGGNRRVQQLDTQRTKLRMKWWRQPTWLISLVSWDRMVTPMMQCSTLSCKHTHTHTSATVTHCYTHKDTLWTVWLNTHL